MDISMWRQLLTIARNTWTESIRQPIFIVLLLVGIGALMLTPSLSAFSMETGGDEKMLIDLGLSTVFLAGLLLAAFTATGVLSDELENKTVLTVVSKPVARPVFVIGKFLGVAGAIALAYFILSITFLMTVRHGVFQTVRDPWDGPVLLFGGLAAVCALVVATWANYFYGKVFTATLAIGLAIGSGIAFALVLVVGKGWVLQSPLTEFTAEKLPMSQIGLGLIMVFEAVMILTAIAIACSTRLKQVMTLVVCLGVFALGLISNSLDDLVNKQIEVARELRTVASFTELFSADVNWGLKLVFALVKVLHLISPNLQFLWPGEALTQGFAIEQPMVTTLTAYAALYIIAMLGIAVILFERREVG
jgi:ABC-type transport system involved in multi-copper enzyme maturation permease subunit